MGRSGFLSERRSSQALDKAILLWAPFGVLDVPFEEGDESPFVGLLQAEAA